jgi:thioesterase domain-containing protein
MAADRVETLLAFRPQGPLILGGFCWGGFVALEMARQLRARGLEVGTLLLIDTDPRTIRWRPMRRALRRIGSVLALDEETELRYFVKGRDFLLVLEAQRGFGSRFRFVLGKLGFSRAAPPAKVEGEEDGAYVAARIPAERHSRWLVYHDINHFYVPEPYAGPVALFRSSRLQDRHPGDPRADWTRISEHVATCDIAGDHWTCVTRHVADVASKMRGYLPGPS